MRVECDFLVIGSGIAGLSFALKAATQGSVFLVSKNTLQEGATRYAQGGIAAVFSPNDSFESHIEDTLVAGAGLCNEAIVDLTVRAGPERIKELIDWGVNFSKTEDGRGYDLTKEAGHHKRRIFHAHDLTGQAIENALIKQVKNHPNITVYEFHTAIDLITNFTIAKQRQKLLPEKRKCLGAYILNSQTNYIQAIKAKVTVLATGGAGKAYLYTTNPDTATGDGIAMAYRAGALVANLEFMQFHPTCLFHPQAKSFLISEALRGEGGELIDSHGHAFMHHYHPKKSLAPRDIVARAIDSEMKKTGASCVYLDMTKLDAHYLTERFPNIYQECLKYSIDLTKQPIPVVPAAHYLCGGVLTDQWGATNIGNLFAIGETACTGLHGANRLASNSLLEGVVFSHRAFEKIKHDHLIAKATHDSNQDKSSMPDLLPEWDSGMAVPMEEQINIHHTWRELRTLMWNYVGIVRTQRRLQKALMRIEIIRHEVQEYYWNYLLTNDLVELRNLVLLCELMVESALLRKESRGLHYTLDYPYRDPMFEKRDTLL